MSMKGLIKIEASVCESVQTEQCVMHHCFVDSVCMRTLPV